MIKAIIFDFDGLIIDTETPWYAAYKEVYRRYGVELPLELWGKVVGTSFDVFNPYTYLAQQSGRSIDEAHVREATKEIFDERIREQVPRPGVAEYLRDAKAMGLSVGLASSSLRSWIEPYLVRFELIEYFDALSTADDVHKVKPDPALYVKALERLNVDGSEAIAFEDSVNGSKAAKAAGAHCVIVPNAVTSYMNFEHYDLRLSSMADMALSSVLDRFNG